MSNDLTSSDISLSIFASLGLKLRSVRRVMILRYAEASVDLILDGMGSA